jgi:hypothetical protein
MPESIGFPAIRGKEVAVYLFNIAKPTDRPLSLNRGIPERSQYGIDFGLVARPLRFEPLKHILIHPKRN